MRMSFRLPDKKKLAVIIACILVVTFAFWATQPEGKQDSTITTETSQAQQPESRAETDMVSTTETVQPAEVPPQTSNNPSPQPSAASKPQTTTPQQNLPTSDPKVVPYVQPPLTPLLQIYQGCTFGMGQTVYTTAVYNSTSANTQGVQLVFKLQLISSGVDLSGYQTSQEFSAFVGPGSSYYNGPGSFSFLYPMIPADGSIRVQLTTLQPFSSTTTSEALTNQQCL